MHKSPSSFTYTSPKSTRNSSRQFLSPDARTNSPVLKKRLTVVKSKISELVLQKKEILKCIQKIDLKLQASYKKEQELITTSAVIEQKINTIEKKKAFFVRFNKSQEVSEKMKLIIKFREYLNRFESVARAEIDLDLLENELEIKENDCSLDTKSSEGNFSGSNSAKEQIQKQLLKNKLCQVDFKNEQLTFSTNTARKRKEIITLNKSRLDAELKSFDMEKEIFAIKSKKLEIFRQEVERKEKLLQEKREKIQSIIQDLIRISAEKDGLSKEMEDLNEKFLRKTERVSLEMVHFQVSQKQEKIHILTESIRKKEKVIEAQKNRSLQIEQMLWNKQQLISAKYELLKILASIDQVVSIPDTGMNKFALVEQKKEDLRVLIQQALRKEKEILAFESN